MAFNSFPLQRRVVCSAVALLVAHLAACGGGGAVDAAVASATSNTPATSSPATGGTATGTTMAPVEAGAPATLATAPSTAATPSSGAASAAAAAATAGIAPTVSNSTAVGTARALSAVASLSMAGVPETPATAAAGTSAAARVFYVDSRTGDDRNDGRAAAASAAAAGPWRTLARVQQSDLGAGDTLVLACDSQWSETLRLPASGTTAKPITVTAPARGCSARPAIDGAVVIAAAAWTPHSGNIYKAALDSPPQQLFAGSGVFTEAHHPNLGAVAADATTPYLLVAADSPTVTVAGLTGSTTLTAGADLVVPAGARLQAGMRVRVRTSSWVLDERAVSRVDGKQFTLASSTTYPVATGWGYVLVGDLWMLDSPGEWYYDRTARQLYAWMPDSLAPSAVAATVRDMGIDVTGKSNIVFDGLAVRHVATGVMMRNSSNVSVRNSVIEDITDIGADAAASVGATLESNAFSRIGQNAVSGQDEGAPAQAMTVRNNVIRDSGVIMDGELVRSIPRHPVGAIRAGVSAKVSGNAIINAGYHGIWPMGGSVVENNFIFGACSVLDDCGGIYVFTERDITIRGNTIVHARGMAKGKPAGQALSQAQGIYLDEHTIATLVEDNTVIDCDNGIQVHVSAQNTIRGNRLYGNRNSQLWMQENNNRYNANGDVYGNTVTGNQIAAVVPGSTALRLETIYASTAAFGSFEGNRYDDRSISTVALVSTASGNSALALDQWRQPGAAAAKWPVEANGSGLGSKGYAGYAVGSGNLIANAALRDSASGWSSYNATAPAGQLTREACATGQCLRYTAGASPGLVSAPNFSIQKGQWYRLSVDLAAQPAAQDVQVVIRRGGGGNNGYEGVSDRNFHWTAGPVWGRFSGIFQATATVVSGDPVTGDFGARVDLEGVSVGQSLSVANMELVPIVFSGATQLSGASINVGGSPQAAACPLATTQPALCGIFRSLADDAPVAWPLVVAPHSAVLLYSRDPALVDSDGDGIPDAQDGCPGTLPGLAVNRSGCAYTQR